jgi:hypothetical protein
MGPSIPQPTFLKHTLDITKREVLMRKGHHEFAALKV